MSLPDSSQDLVNMSKFPCNHIPAVTARWLTIQLTARRLL